MEGIRGQIRRVWRDTVPYDYDVQANLALLLGRVLVGVQLLPNGLRKLNDFTAVAAAMGGVPQVINGRPFPDQQPLVTFVVPEFFLGLSVAFDLLGGALLLLGWRARSVAALLAGYVVLAMGIFHSDIRGPMDVQAVLRNLPFLGALLVFAALGAGRWSMDGWRHGPSALALTRQDGSAA